jgi:signal transduction histidine kinase
MIPIWRTVSFRRRRFGLKRGTAIPRWLRTILEIPLEPKLLGANLFIVGMAVLVLFGPVHLNSGRLTDVLVLVFALLAGAIVNFALVRLALRPITALERVARRVSQGRLAERVPASIVADRDLAQLSTTINDMLDKLAAGRERMRKLGAEVVYAEERERASVARELHDSVAQTLAAASFQVAAIAYEIGDHEASPRVVEVRQLLRSATSACGKSLLWPNRPDRVLRVSANRVPDIQCGVVSGACRKDSVSALRRT